MGYYKQLEISNQVEEPDRFLPKSGGEVLSRRKLRAGRRGTYRAPKHWVVRNADMAMIFALVPVTFALGVVLTILVVTAI
jgi:hypothetical protein